jgi:hypothetical protein
MKSAARISPKPPRAAACVLARLSAEPAKVPLAIDAELALSQDETPPRPSPLSHSLFLCAEGAPQPFERSVESLVRLMQEEN